MILNDFVLYYTSCFRRLATPAKTGVGRGAPKPLPHIFSLCLIQGGPAGTVFCGALDKPRVPFLFCRQRVVLLKKPHFCRGGPGGASFCGPKPTPHIFALLDSGGPSGGGFFRGFGRRLLFAAQISKRYLPTPDFLAALESPGAPGASSRFRARFHPSEAGWNTNRSSHTRLRGLGTASGALGTWPRGNAPLQAASQTPLLYLPPFRPGGERETAPEGVPGPLWAVILLFASGLLRAGFL